MPQYTTTVFLGNYEDEYFYRNKRNLKTVTPGINRGYFGSVIFKNPFKITYRINGLENRTQISNNRQLFCSESGR